MKRCEGCGATDRPLKPEPFGHTEVCDECFTLIAGGEPGEPPWRCGGVTVSQGGDR